MSQPRCLVTVVGTRKQVDLAVPADAPIAEYSDLLARLVGQESDEALPAVWSLAPTGSPPLPVTASLASVGVVDGTLLYLRDTLASEADEPVVRSVWEVVNDLGNSGRGPRWDVRAKGRVAMLLAAGWLVVALGYLGFTGQHPLLVEALTAVVGIGLAVTARLLQPYPRVLPHGLRVLLGCAVIPSMIMVAVLSLGDPTWDAAHLVYAEIGAVLGLIIALIAVPGVLLAAVTLLVVLAGAITTVVLAFGATPAAAAGTVVTAGTLFLAVAPRVAGLLTAASWLRMSSASVEPQADPDHLAGRVSRARHTLLLLMGVTSAIVAVAQLVLVREASAFAIALTAVATVALFVRAGTFEFMTEAIGPVLAALAGTFGLLATLAHWSATAPLVVPLMLIVGVAALGVGLPVLLWRAGTTAEPDDNRPSRLRPLLTVCQLALPPLLLGVYGVYGLLWGLGRNF
ncbi:type VII secretion integral membrane protein EccD [Micromonospora pisi]|uniref:Type VII secretion integral membrane protein EccD n=1 Tax=Micromonospora pisi TaxID=589240 RepID=A0A495JN12_9ACTN|nr:EsaB/YukD family protein [Micromonospora pisi]RKR89419.1 type VII secretion integral membrane protein EccD [Micromonospora pisi]